jgi:hypothetical protein
VDERAQDQNRLLRNAFAAKYFSPGKANRAVRERESKILYYVELSCARCDLLGCSMGFFYFDESIHERGHFALGAFVYTEESLDGPVADALSKGGLTPGMDEFRSGSRMDRCPEQARTRNLLHSVIFDNNCRIGVVVAPHYPCLALGPEAIIGLKKILSTNQFRTGSHEAFFDEGIFGTASAGGRAVGAASIFQPCRFHFEQDSVQVLGIQVADLVAHTCATMLLAQLGVVKKMVKSGEDSGYDPDSDVELEFKLWAGLRYNFFAAAPPPVATWESQLDFQVDVKSRGLHIADTCEEKVQEAALVRFGSMYLGCIH